MAPSAILLPLMGLIFGGAQALNSNETHPTTTFATYVKETTQTSSAGYSAPTLGSGIDNSWNCARGFTEDGTICNEKGSFDKSIQFIESLPISFSECLSTCKADRDCNFFYYEDNLCQTFGDDVASAGFRKGDSKGSWYQNSCFACVKPEERPVSLNFEDGNIEAWYLDKPNDDAFFTDALRIKAPYDGFTTAFTLFEMQDSGTGRLEYNDIQISAGQYRLGFVGKNNVQRTASTGTQWDNVNIEVTSVDGDLYDGPVKNGIPLDPGATSGWFSFMMDFVAPIDTTAGIAISVAQNGLMLNWYFDDIYLIKLY